MTIQWSSLLTNTAVLSLLERMLAKGVETVELSVGGTGEVVYSVSGGGADEKLDELLDSLVKAGVFERKSQGRLLCCPQHDRSIDLSPRLRCPTCSSTQLTKGSILQHSCGYIGPAETFGADCPHCKKPAPAQSLKAVGTWYECESCHKRSAQPNVFLFCKKYQHDFAIGLAKLLDQATYSFTPEAAAQMRGRLGVVFSIFDGLKSAGLDLEVYGRVMGASGVQHEFDLILKRGENKIPIDVKIGETGSVDVVGVLSTYAKALDTKSNPTILVAVPNASEDAKKTSGAYGLILLEGRDGRSIAQGILSKLEIPSASGSFPEKRVGAASVIN